MDDSFTFLSNAGFQPLREPCQLDCVLDGDAVTLILDRADPRYLFLCIEGEVRRAYDLSSYSLAFSSRREAVSFLESLRDSEFFQNLMQEERDMNREWDAL